MFNLFHGKNSCMDITGGSPFNGTRVPSCALGVSLAKSAERKTRSFCYRGLHHFFRVTQVRPSLRHTSIVNLLFIFKKV